LNNVTFISPVQAQLQLVEARLQAQADDRHPDLRAALGQILSAGGKRIRPTITLLVGNMLDAQESTRYARCGDGIASHCHTRS